MKTLASCLVILVLLAGFCIVDGQTSDTPIVVSPGSDTGLATVSQTCPTFSWSAVEQASSYWIAVFQSPDATVRPYADIAAIASPVIVKEIAGPALSWTLPAEEQLRNGALYAWYVQAVDAGGNRLGSCSNGRLFKVEQEAAWAGMDGKMEEILRARGVGEDVIADAMKDLKSSATDVSMFWNAFDQKPSKVSGTKAVGATNAHYGLDYGTEGPLNTFYGTGAGASISSGAYDTFIGANAGYNNTSGGANTIVGYAAGYNNTTGVANTFMGDAAGNSNTTGGDNTFIGRWTGWSNTTGYENTFIGSNAGGDNTTGHNNTILGNSAGYYSTTANFNTFVGNASGYNNTTGGSNTFTGNATGFNNTTGLCNTFLGDAAGNRNTTGGYNAFMGRFAGTYNTTGSYNAFIGNNAGLGNTTGYENAFLGSEAGYSNTTGCWNTFNGYQAGYSNTTGYNNTYIGDYAGGNSNGIGNTFIGNEAGYNETGSNKLYIHNSSTSSPLIYGEFNTNIVNINGSLGIGTKTPGYPMEMVRSGTNASIVVNRADGAKNYINATDSYGNFGTTNNFPLRLVVNSAWRMRLNADNSLTMANGATCSAGGTWANASSIALKENISSLGSEEAARTLQSLNPVKYNYKAEKDQNHVGFIAEEVPDLVAMKDRKSLSPMDIIAVLTRVTQDQQKQLKEQKQINENLTRKMLEQQQINQKQIQQIIEKMESEIAELKKNRS